MTTDTIIYEQPLNEYLRVCLRLETLFQQVYRFAGCENIETTRAALTSLLEIVNLLERPDLKTKLIKALSLRTSNFVALEQSPNVDNKKLKELLTELDRHVDFLHASPMKLAQDLRDNEFLNSIRLQLSKPGGITNYGVPAYNFWLHQTSEHRSRDLLNWLKSLEPIYSLVMLLLQLTRESAKFQLKFATLGFYQESLDASVPYQLIRVQLTSDRRVFPEISVGRHRLSIHYFSPNFEGRPVRATHDIQFKIACCVI